MKETLQLENIPKPGRFLVAWKSAKFRFQQFFIHPRKRRQCVWRTIWAMNCNVNIDVQRWSTTLTYNVEAQLTPSLEPRLLRQPQRSTAYCIYRETPVPFAIESPSRVVSRAMSSKISFNESTKNTNLAATRISSKNTTSKRSSFLCCRHRLK